MKWLRTGRSLGQAVKNVGRLRQILGVFAKYGFVDVVERIGLTRFLPSRLVAYARGQMEHAPQERLRLAFEELGPTFVKLGQLLSTRPDLLPEAYIEEFTKLQDNVHPLSFEVVQTVIERELKMPISSAFARLDAQPLASASIAQVHTAELQTGEHVVVKVQRPDIERTIQQDIALMAFLAGLLEKYIPEIRVISPRTFVDEFFRTLSYELDFVVEANNMIRIAENLSEFEGIVIPRVYSALSTKRVLTMDRLEGIRVNDLRAMDAAGIDRKKIVDLGARAFMKSVMIDGFFHGDLHGGNLFVLPGDRLGIIDFGVVGRLSEQSRAQLASMTVSLIEQDFERLCYLYAELGSAEASVDLVSFQREVQNALSPYLGLPIGQLNMGKILIEATRIATRYKIQVPGDWMIVFKAILTIEGMGRTLDPDFDLLKLGQSLVNDLVWARYSPTRLLRDTTWFMQDLGQLLQVLPRQLRWMLRKFNRNDFAFEIKSQQFEDIRRTLDLNGRRLGAAVISVGLLLAGAISLNFNATGAPGEYPLVSLLFFGLGGVGILSYLVRLR